ncbi:hypothetical protein [Microcoleus sp. S36b_A2]|uniref:hypothetical protein n=1 Tax=Microcoleus sp. S36b_A2 TaxID=3055418 RepID=UPI002FD20DBF
MVDAGWWDNCSVFVLVFCGELAILFVGVAPVGAGFANGRSGEPIYLTNNLIAN